MKFFLEFMIGFFSCIVGFIGLFGMRSLFRDSANKKIAKKVMDAYEKIDTSVDTRSDLDVLRKL